MALCSLALAACAESRPGESRVQWGVRFAIRPRCPDRTDLLLVVDDSISMREEQANLAANIPAIVHRLVFPPDEDGDGVPDYPALEDMHLAVLTTDMGTGGHPVETCNDTERGDDGQFQSSPGGDPPGCRTGYPRFLSWDLEEPDPEFSDDAACLAQVGTDGCEIEQPLAAIEKALTVHAAPGGVNDGFLREYALLAIFLVTDEDDCSVADPASFRDVSGEDPTVWCREHPERLRPVADLVENILALKPGRPDRIVVAGIAGVPPDLVALSETRLRSDDIQSTRGFDEILADPRMRTNVEDGIPIACDVPGLGRAAPSRRIVEFIRDIDREGNNGLVQSVCQADWTPVNCTITRLIQSHHDWDSCLPLWHLEPVEAGEHVPCVVHETLPDDADCGPGRVRIGTDDGRTVCHVCQVGDGEEGFETDALGNDLSSCAGSPEHWSVTTEDEYCGRRWARIVFTEEVEPACGTLFEMECAAVGTWEDFAG